MILSQQWSKYYTEEILNPCIHGWVMCTCQNLSFKMTWTNFAKLYFHLFYIQKILKSNSFTQDGNLGLDIAMKFYWNLLSVCCRKFCGGSLIPGITTLIKQAWWEYYNNTSLWLLMMFYLSFSHLEVLAAWSIGGLYLHTTNQDHVTKDSSCQILIPWV